MCIYIYIATIQRFGVIRIFFFKYINTFIHQEHIQLKNDSKYIYNVTKDFYFK